MPRAALMSGDRFVLWLTASRATIKIVLTRLNHLGCAQGVVLSITELRGSHVRDAGEATIVEVTSGPR